MRRALFAGPGAAVRREARRALSEQAAPKTEAASEAIKWPWYLKALGLGAGVGGAGTTVVLVLQHEYGIRAKVDAVAPALVDLVRSRFPFKDEDPDRRRYALTLERARREGPPHAVLAGGKRVLLDGATPASAARTALGEGVGDLDLAFEDEPDVDDGRGGGGGGDAPSDAHDGDDAPSTRPFALERFVARRGASVWAANYNVAPTAAEVEVGKRDAILALEDRKRDIGADLASGRRQVDDVQAEVQAIDDRIRDLQTGGKRRWFWNA